MTFRRIALFIARGFGTGRAPVAPGTFGTLVGFAWYYALIAGHNWAIFAVGILFGIFASVLLSELAEDALGQKDPGSVVIDEIIAIPICLAPWVYKHGLVLPPFKIAALVFVAFRVFDVWKPWPVRQSQALPGGWGVTIDDVLAAIYVAALFWIGQTLLN